MDKFKPYDYDQMVMIPITLKEQLEPGTLEYAIHELVKLRRYYIMGWRIRVEQGEFTNICELQLAMRNIF